MLLFDIIVIICAVSAVIFFQARIGLLISTIRGILKNTGYENQTHTPLEAIHEIDGILSKYEAKKNDARPYSS